MEQSPLLPSKPSGSEQSVLLAFRALQTSWLRYWQDVSVFWESLMKCFATGGNWMALKDFVHSDRFGQSLGWSSQ